MNGTRVKNVSSGFTLIELMTVVTITGILASVAIPQFQKYIKRSKLSEGLIELRTVYDAQYVVGANPVMLVRRPGLGDIECIRIPRFVRLCMQWLEGTQMRYWPPPGRKEPRRYYGGKPSFYTYSVAGTPPTIPSNSCSYALLMGPFGLLTLTSQITSVGPAIGFSENLEPGYFVVRSRTDSTLATAQGISVNDTMTIYVLADLDGDHNKTMTNCNTDPYQTTDMTVLARSMYYKDDAIQGFPGIVQHNVLE